MSQAAAGSLARGRVLRGAVAALLVAAAAVAPSAIPASAYQIQTAALTGTTGTNGTAVQTFPSGLTATWATTGVTTVSSLTNGMSAKNATSAMFTPGISTATAMPDFVTDGAGCAANSVCANRGTITLTFNRPVRNPVLHIAGLGGYATQGGQTSTVRASGTITSTGPGGATLAAPAANAVNLAVSNAGLTWDTSVTRPAVGCAATTIAAQNGFAGCGSIPVTGLVSSLTFRIDLIVVATGGSASLSLGDDFLMGVTVPEDFGDAPASYDAGTAASAIAGDLALGASVDAENATTANGTASPNAVAAGADANSPSGDGADENAMSGFPTLTTAMIGSTYAVTVPISGAGAAGQVCGWIDVDRGGTFTAGESACASFAAGATSVPLSWTVPAATSAGTTYARLRASYNTTQVSSPTGRTDSGEVEDYTLAVLPVVRVTKVVPYADPGTFDLSVNGTTVAAAAGDGGTSGARTVFHTSSYGSPDLTVTQNVATTAVPLTVSEAASGTTTGSYSSALACVDATGATVASDTGTSASVTIPASTGSNGRQQDLTCTFTNTPAAALTLTKSVAFVTDTNGNGQRDAGDVVSYSLLVRNSGGAPVTALSITDPLLTGVSCPSTALAQGATTTCTGSHALTQAEVDAGTLTNTATATASAAGTPVTSAPSSAILTITPSPGLLLGKSVSALTDTNGSGVPDAGDTISWGFALTNTGTVTLSALAVSDPTAGPVTCAATSLGPGASTSCTAAAHTITQAEGDAGVVTNTATASGRTPADDTTASNPAGTSTALDLRSTLTLTKSATVTDVDSSGDTSRTDTVAWSFLVRNTGSVTLSALAVADATAGVVSCPVTTLAPGASTTCTAPAHPVTQSEVDAGVVSNTATASARTPSAATVISDPSSTDTPVAQTAALALVKSAAVDDVDGSGRTDLGDEITWTFALSNTGTVTLSALAVADPTAGVVSCPVTTLAPGASTTCTAAAHPVTQAEVDAGVVSNTATAGATDPDGAAVTSPPSSVSTPVARSTGVALVKAASTDDVNGNGSRDLGDRVIWSFAVTNSGTTGLSAIGIADPVAGTVTCPQTTLAPAASITCTAPAHIVTQSDVDAGLLSNTATVTGAGPGGAGVQATSSTDSPIAQSRGLALVKSSAVTDVNGNGRTDAGDAITWSFLVTNSGTVSVAALAVGDPVAGPVSCPVTALAPGASTTCSAAAHTITAADVDAGVVSNTATATGQAPAGGAVVSQISSTDTPVVQSSGLSLVKSASVNDLNGNGLTDLGDTIGWSFLVTDSGTTTLTSITVTDPLAGAVTCPGTALATGASFTCTATATHPVTQADVDAGLVANTATAAGIDPSGTAVSTSPAFTDTPVAQSRSLSLTKSATVTDADGNGTDLADTLTWSFVVRNTGTVTVAALAVDDPVAGPVSCPVSTLAPGASTTCSAAAHTISQAEVDAGVVSNTATASGRAPDGGPAVSQVSSTDTPVSRSSGLSLVKSAAVNDLNGNGVTDLGDTIGWSFQVRNTGTVTVTGPTVSDPTAGAVTCPVVTLAPGAWTTCTAAATHTVAQADVDAAGVTNTAVATATGPDGAPVSATDTATARVEQDRGMALTKSASVNDLNGNGIADLGDTIGWSFQVRNTGTVSIGSITVTDARTAVTCPLTALAPSASTTCTGDTAHPVTQADVDAGVVSNTATAAAADAAAHPVAASPSSTDTPIAQARGLGLVKSAAVTDADGDGTDLGDTITWSFLVTNTGTVGLTTLAVTDPAAGAVTCPVTALAPSASTTCTAAAHPVTQADVDAGVVSNTATAAATTPAGGSVLSPASSTDTPVTRSGGLLLVKSAAVSDLDGDGVTGLGDRVTWSFAVTNTGTVTLTTLEVTDPAAGSVTCPVATLAPGAVTTCTAGAHPVTQADVDAGAVPNAATASARDPGGRPVTADAAVTTPVAQTRGLSVLKSAQVSDTDVSGSVTLDDVITWSFVVTNTGTVTVAAIAVDDPRTPVRCPVTTLAPGAWTTCTADTPHPVTQADVDAGRVANTATAHGQAPLGGPVVSQTSSTDTAVAQARALGLVKSAAVTDTDLDGRNDLGDLLTWSFVVTNTGTVTVDNLTIADPTAGAVTCPVTTLAPAASTTCTAPAHAVTQADVDAGLVSNTATAQGEAPAGGPVVSQTSSTDTPLAQSAALALTKSAAATDADGDGSTEAGDEIAWSFQVRNTGTVTVTALAISDPVAGPVSCPVTSLAPGAATTCTADAAHTVVQADVDAAVVSNSATVSGTSPLGQGVLGGPSTTDTPLAHTGALTLVKSALVSDPGGDGTGLGDEISWSFLATNTGVVTLNGLTVSDPVAGPVSCPVTMLAPSASTTCTADTPHPVTQADVDAGVVANTATASATDPGGATVPAGASSTNTAVHQVRGLRAVKSATVNDLNGNGATDLGDTITWTVTVTNTGTVTIGGLAVNDPTAGPVTCPASTLAPSASTVCTAAAAHPVTQADVDAGIVSNTATAQGRAPAGGPVVAQTSSTDTPVAQSTGLHLTKSAAVNDLNGNGATDLADTIAWSFTVTNTGTVSVHGLAVGDPVAGAVTCPATTLAPGAATACTAASVHPVTQADVDAGVVSNTATATALDQAGRTVPANPSVTDTPIAQLRGLALVKAATVTDTGGNGITDLGDVITWSFTVTNTGSVGLSWVAVSDPVAGAVTCAATALAPGGSTACSAPAHPVTQPDVDAGVVANTATAAALDAGGGGLTSAPSLTDTPIARSAGVRLIKSASVDDVDGNGADLGDTITWSFQVTNTGSVTVHSLAVTDPDAGTVTCPDTTLAPGASTTCTVAPRPLVQADVDAAVVRNTATASALGPDGVAVPVSMSSTGTPVTQLRGLRLVKVAAFTDTDGSGVRDLGDTIAWSFQVTNTGTVTVAALAISDPVAGAVTCAATTLAPGATISCTAATPYPIVQADVDAGVVSNTATVTGQAPAGGAPVTASASTDTALDRSSSLGLTKAAAVTDVDGSGRTDLGDEIAWSFLVTNTGTVSLDTVAVADPAAGAVTCPVTSLAPSASTTCTADAAHVVGQGDVDAGVVSNAATASARNPSGGAVGTPVSSTDTPIAQARGLRLVKSATLTDANGNGTADLADVITWSFQVTNTGSLTLHNLAVADPAAGAVTCPVTSLAPSASTTCTAGSAHPVTQPDVDAGLVANVATATADDPAGAPVAPSSSSTDTPISQSRALALTKSASVTDTDGNGVTELADVVTWSFQVRNTGSVSIDAITVDDPSAGTVTCPVASLAPGASTTCTAAAHTITQADVDAGVVANTATARGIAGSGPNASPVSGSSSTDTPVARAQGLSLTKSATTTDVDADGSRTLGDTLHWSFLLTNTGTVTLNALAVSDPAAGSVTCPVTSLAPSASTTCTADSVHTVSQGDVDAGVVSNTATAGGTDPTGIVVTTGPSSTDSPIAQSRGIALVKSASVTDPDGDGTDLSDRIAWSFTVTNTGTATVSALTVDDPGAGPVTCPATTLAPGASTTCTADATHPINQGEVDAGVVSNTATAHGIAGAGPGAVAVAATSSTDTPVLQASALRLTKSASVADRNGSGGTDLGDEVSWSFLVANTGSVTLDTLLIDDPVAGAVTCPVTTLAPGASTTCTADDPHPISQAEVDAAAVVNTATATARDSLGATRSSNSSTVTTPVRRQLGLALIKTSVVDDVDGDGRTDLGDTVTWAFLVRNTGSVTITALVVDDPAAGSVTCPVTVLAPSASTTCTAGAAHTVTQADLDVGVLANTATASGQATSGPRVTSPESTTDTPLAADGALHLVKSAMVNDVDGDHATTAADEISWTFTVTNTGSQTLTGLAVDDPTAGPVTCPVTTLAPGARTTCTADEPHPITAEEAETGVVRNTARASGAIGVGQVLSSNSATAMVTVKATPTPTPSSTVRPVPPRSGPLPFTGAVAVGAALALGGALLALGFALVVIGGSRRRAVRTRP